MRNSSSTLEKPQGLEIIGDSSDIRNVDPRIGKNLKNLRGSANTRIQKIMPLDSLNTLATMEGDAEVRIVKTFVPVIEHEIVELDEDDTHPYDETPSVHPHGPKPPETRAHDPKEKPKRFIVREVIGYWKIFIIRSKGFYERARLKRKRDELDDKEKDKPEKDNTKIDTETNSAKRKE